MKNFLYKSYIKSVPLLHRGKIRDVYSISIHKLLIVTSDRVSAFDKNINNPIPYKGILINRLNKFWFRKIKNLVPNHMIDISSKKFLNYCEFNQIKNRYMIVKKLKPIRIESIIREYLVGSIWYNYKKNGFVYDLDLPKHINYASKLPKILFTPSIKSSIGEFDKNIDFDYLSKNLGIEISDKIISISMNIYKHAKKYALKKNIIIADTKFEFGIDNEKNIYLIDEIFTPDSSRFLEVKNHEGINHHISLDKQILRNWINKKKLKYYSYNSLLSDDLIFCTINNFYRLHKLLIF